VPCSSAQALPCTTPCTMTWPILSTKTQALNTKQNPETTSLSTNSTMDLIPKVQICPISHCNHMSPLMMLQLYLHNQEQTQNPCQQSHNFPVPCTLQALFGTGNSTTDTTQLLSSQSNPPTSHTTQTTNGNNYIWSGWIPYISTVCLILVQICLFESRFAYVSPFCSKYYHSVLL